jgi:ABC-type amino acid transport substrate-binding protein
VKKLILTVAAIAAFSSVGAKAFAASDPCEDRIAALRAEMLITKISAADMELVKALEAKSLERCNADDDKRADGFVADAMKIMGK